MLLADDLSFDITELNKAERVLNHIITAGDSLAQLLGNNDIMKIPEENYIIMNIGQAGDGVLFQEMLRCNN
jgi:hypothetical protein